MRKIVVFVVSVLMASPVWAESYVNVKGAFSFDKPDNTYIIDVSNVSKYRQNKKLPEAIQKRIKPYPWPKQAALLVSDAVPGYRIAINGITKYAQGENPQEVFIEFNEERDAEIIDKRKAGGISKVMMMKKKIGGLDTPLYVASFDSGDNYIEMSMLVRDKETATEAIEAFKHIYTNFDMSEYSE
ncbi:MAG: hypothetical protein CMM94_04360 [Rickettsiales bacterium]|nr:hypothetical protein [Rickettsiales bacterium]|tara:strand:+ start:159 stop:713 length:555 start_codon:yes stop_codon:yes gene_type:complete